MKALALVTCLGLVASVACTRTVDPCAEGMVRQGDRCMAVGMDATTPATGDAEAEAAALEGGGDAHDADTSSDASDAQALPLDADVLVDAQSVGRDDAEGPDAALPSQCFAPDITRWQRFHLSDQLIQHASYCGGLRPNCLPGTCSLDECLRVQAGITSCATCVKRETDCLATRCRRACGVAGTSDACRACACASGCSDLFDSCADVESEVCDDCEGTTCVRPPEVPPEVPAPLSPALIMVIVDGM